MPLEKFDLIIRLDVGIAFESLVNSDLVFENKFGNCSTF